MYKSSTSLFLILLLSSCSFQTRKYTLGYYGKDYLASPSKEKQIPTHKAIDQTSPTADTTEFETKEFQSTETKKVSLTTSETSEHLALPLTIFMDTIHPPLPKDEKTYNKTTDNKILSPLIQRRNAFNEIQWLPYLTSGALGIAGMLAI